MLNIIFYMDCRAIGLLYYLKNKIIFNPTRYEVHIVGRFSEKGYLTEENHNLDIELLKNADIFIYQFIDKEYLIYSTDPFLKNENILSYLSDKCIKIGLQGTYMDCFWSIIPAPIYRNSDFFNSIKDKTPEYIISAFQNKELDFNLKERFNKNIEYTLSREEYWKNGFLNDNNYYFISSIDFIKNNYKEHRLFFTHCHPTSYIFIQQTNEIINIINKCYGLNIEIYNDIFTNSIKYPEIPDGDWPDSSYVIKELDVKWINETNDDYYLSLILNNYK